MRCTAPKTSVRQPLRKPLRKPVRWPNGFHCPRCTRAEARSCAWASPQALSVPKLSLSDDGYCWNDHGNKHAIAHQVVPGPLSGGRRQHRNLFTRTEAKAGNRLSHGMVAASQDQASNERAGGVLLSCWAQGKVHLMMLSLAENSLVERPDGNQRTRSRSSLPFPLMMLGTHSPEAVQAGHLLLRSHRRLGTGRLGTRL